MDPEGYRGPDTPLLENRQLLCFSLEILVYGPPLGPFSFGFHEMETIHHFSIFEPSYNGDPTSFSHLGQWNCPLSMIMMIQVIISEICCRLFLSLKIDFVRPS